uniref:Uncharacterized protein n=1 Tax=Arion vulgaris TaxID=1028688 RepID=A0A0B7AS99_9EUPU
MTVFEDFDNFKCILFTDFFKDIQSLTVNKEEYVYVGIVLPNEYQHTEMTRCTGINNISQEIKSRRWKWLAHTFRIQKTRHPHVVLKWNP